MGNCNWEILHCHVWLPERNESDTHGCFLKKLTNNRKKTLWLVIDANLPILGFLKHRNSQESSWWCWKRWKTSVCREVFSVKLGDEPGDFSISIPGMTQSSTSSPQLSLGHHLIGDRNIPSYSNSIEISWYNAPTRCCVLQLQFYLQ